MVALAQNKQTSGGVDAFGAFDLSAAKTNHILRERIIEALRKSGTIIQTDDTNLATHAGQLKEQHARRHKLRILLEYLMETSQAYRRLFTNTLNKLGKLNDDVANAMSAATLGQTFSYMTLDWDGARRYKNQIKQLKRLKNTRLQTYNERLHKTPLIEEDTLQDMNKDIGKLASWKDLMTKNKKPNTPLPPISNTLNNALDFKEPRSNNEPEQKPNPELN